jgi:chemotaxis signal transduction protein
MQYITIDKSVGILIFEISSLEFGSNIDQVRLLNPSKKYLIKNGKFELDGKDVLLIDLAKLFSLNSNVTLKKKNVLLYEYKEKLYGFLIDSVKEILNLDQNYMEMFKKSNHNSNEQLLLGKLNFEGRIILFPDYNAILEESLTLIKN